MRTKIEKTKDDIESTVNQYSALIYKIAFSYTKSSSAAEDILQDVLIAYITSPNEYSDSEHKKAWLIRVTVNECRKYFRRLKYQLLYEKIPAIADADSANNSDVTFAVMELPAKYRIVIHLYYYEQLSVHEISTVLKLKENTVMSLLHRARKKLKKIMEENYEHKQIPPDFK